MPHSVLCKFYDGLTEKNRKTDVLRGEERKEELMNAPKDKLSSSNKDDSYGLTKPNS